MRPKRATEGGSVAPGVDANSRADGPLARRSRIWTACAGFLQSEGCSAGAWAHSFHCEMEADGLGMYSWKVEDLTHIVDVAFTHAKILGGVGESAHEDIRLRDRGGLRVRVARVVS